MYEQFYNLSSRPFDTTPDEKFVWLGEHHKEALAALRYGIIENKGFLLLTGDQGTGKTSIINTLVRNLGDDVEWAIISDPALDRIDFYNAIAAGFSLEKDFTSKVQFLIQFSHFLHKAHDDGKKVVLLVDNCQRLTQEMLEELRLLSNIEKTETKLINIFFIGETEFNDILAQPKNRAVRQRMTLKVELPPLGMDETAEYIKHRLSVVGSSEKLFSAKAVNAIHRISRGIPRNINVICAYAMVAGAVRGKKSIDHRLVEECLAKLGLPAHPDREDLASLSGDHRSLENFRERFISNGGMVNNGVTGYNFEEENKRSWLKYGVVAAAFVAFGTYLWWPQPKEVKMVDISEPPAATEQVEEQPKVPLKPINTSPAVAMLENENSKINEDKASALKSAILEKAYSDDSQDDTTPAEKVAATADTAGDVGETSLATVASIHQEVALEPPQEEAVADVANGAPAEADNTLPQDVPEVVVVTDDTEQQVILKAKNLKREKSVVAEDEPKPGVEAVVAAETQPQEALPSIEGEKFVLSLQANSIKLTNDGRKDLKRMQDLLANYPDAKLLVKGYVSSKNNSPENIKLSEERAANVRKFLVQEGFSEKQMEVKGMGNQEPIASNDTSAGRAKNRRVEVVVVDDGI